MALIGFSGFAGGGRFPKPSKGVPNFFLCACIQTRVGDVVPPETFREHGVVVYVRGELRQTAG
jgi:hypothetical protein